MAYGIHLENRSQKFRGWCRGLHCLGEVCDNKGLVYDETCYLLEKGNVNFSVIIFPYNWARTVIYFIWIINQYHHLCVCVCVCISHSRTIIIPQGELEYYIHKGSW